MCLAAAAGCCCSGRWRLHAAVLLRADDGHQHTRTGCDPGGWQQAVVVLLLLLCRLLCCKRQGENSRYIVTLAAAGPSHHDVFVSVQLPVLWSIVVCVLRWQPTMLHMTATRCLRLWPLCCVVSCFMHCAGGCWLAARCAAHAWRRGLHLGQRPGRPAGQRYQRRHRLPVPGEAVVAAC